MTTYGVDTARYQPDFPLKAAMEHDGIAFHIARATRGADDYVDPTFAPNLEEAKRLGALFAAYHFIYHEPPSSQVVRIKQHVPKDIPVMLDLEKSDAGGKPDISFANAMDLQLQGAGYKTFLYLPRWYWEQIGRPSLSRWKGRLCASRYPTERSGTPKGLYPGEHGPGWDPYGGVEPTLWQYSSKGRISTYGARNVDLDAYRGTRAQLAKTGLFKDFAVKAKPPKPTVVRGVEIDKAIASLKKVTRPDALDEVKQAIRILQGIPHLK